VYFIINGHIFWLDDWARRKWITSFAREENRMLGVICIFIGNLKSKLGDDAANGPHVGLGVIVCAQDDFWWPVPSRAYEWTHFTFLSCLLSLSPLITVADLTIKTPG